ncbi:MAG: TetR/AcrR family transcriptional regulator [Chlamydiales bacterium]
MKTDKRILRLAIQLIQKHGLSGWSYEDIAQRIEIKKASIHYYFPSKSDLILAAVQQYIAELKDELETIRFSSQSAKKKLLALAKIYHGMYQKNDQLCLCVILSQNLSHLPAEVGKELDDYFKNLRTFIRTIIREGIDQKEFYLKKSSVEGSSELFLASLQGLLLLGNYKIPERHFEQAVSFFLFSIKKID